MFECVLTVEDVACSRSSARRRRPEKTIKLTILIAAASSLHLDTVDVSVLEKHSDQIAEKVENHFCQEIF